MHALISTINTVKTVYESNYHRVEANFLLYLTIKTHYLSSIESYHMKL